MTEETNKASDADILEEMRWENEWRWRDAFSALIAERDALREDAERWRHARILLTDDDIEGMRGAYESFGKMVSEEECKRADAAIDAARTIIAKVEG